MSLYRKRYRNNWYIYTKHNGKFFKVSTRASDKNTAQLIHDEFITALRQTGQRPDIVDIIKRCAPHINRWLKKKGVSQEEKRKPPETARNIYPSSALTVTKLSYRLRKFEIRRYLVELAATTLKTIKAVTLPGTEWLFERDLMLTGKCKKIVGLEIDPGIYRFTQNNVPVAKHTSISYLNISDEGYFLKKTQNGKFNLLWLDYMGLFNSDKLCTFENVLKNKFIGKRAIIALTFLNGRETKETQRLYLEYGEPDYSKPHHCGRLNNLRLTAIPMLYADIAAKYGYQTEIKKTTIYTEPVGAVQSTPMIFIALTLKKEGKHV